MPHSYAPQFRATVIEQDRSGRSVAEVAASVEVSESTVYRWVRQDRIDCGERAGTSTMGNAELRAARRRITELEAELATVKRASELFAEGRVVRPKALYAIVETLAREGHGTKRVCRLLRVAPSGFFRWLTRCCHHSPMRSSIPTTPAPPDSHTPGPTLGGQIRVDRPTGVRSVAGARAVEAKVLKTNRLRADTTVVEANVAYPVDSSLFAKGVARLVKLARRAHAGVGHPQPVTRPDRSVQRRARDVVNTLPQRGDLARDRLGLLNAELVTITRASVREATGVIRNARRRLRRLGTKAAAANAPSSRHSPPERLARVAHQTRQRVVDGITPEGATRIVSLHDPDARPIRKGRLGRPVEFGCKAQQHLAAATGGGERLRRPWDSPANSAARTRSLPQQCRACVAMGPGVDQPRTLPEKRPR